MKRREVRISAFRRYFTFLVLVGRFPRSVKFPPFLIIEGSFSIYYSVIWRARIDERCACPCYEDILHFLVLGGWGLSFILVSSSQFFIIKGSFTMYSNVVWRTWRDKRSMFLHSRDIQFWWAGTLGQSNFHHFLWSKACLQFIIVSFKGPK